MQNPTISEDIWRKISGGDASNRFTQDTPILPEVWKAFIAGANYQELLLTPYRGHRAAALTEKLWSECTDANGVPLKEGTWFSFNPSAVLAHVDFAGVITTLLPMTAWWGRLAPQVRPAAGTRSTRASQLESIWAALDPKAAKRTRQALAALVESPWRSAKQAMGQTLGIDPELAWMLRLIGIVALSRTAAVRRQLLADTIPTGKQRLPSTERILTAARKALEPLARRTHWPDQLIWTISVNRRASVGSVDSVTTVKADAARRLFELSCKNIKWAVLDTGIDAVHPAFHDENGDSRVTEAYDFTRLDQIIRLGSSPDAADEQVLIDQFGLSRNAARKVRRSLRGGRDIEWEDFRPLLQIAKPADHPPVHPHGTHVAGVLAASPQSRAAVGQNRSQADVDEAMEGMCPDIGLIDLRVLDDQGFGSEFAMIGALQFVRYLNAHSEKPVVHGVNMSFSIPHEVSNYACGRTPICDECERLVGSGVVAVAAAGNLGFGPQGAPIGSRGQGYQDVSITDPGNADGVITVGATHRRRPHTYGVSFFSSRGPTGDGRTKPDLVAPGEKILGPVPHSDVEKMDGTSQAAPHVSGAAALLMARHPELIGNPGRIKQILCDTCTDLGRERYFQGHGLLDVLRALQSV